MVLCKLYMMGAMYSCEGRKLTMDTFYAAKPIIAKFIVYVLHGRVDFVGVPHNHLVANNDIEKGVFLEALDVVLDTGGYGARVKGDGS